jgi:hypothetical protein
MNNGQEPRFNSSFRAGTIIVMPGFVSVAPSVADARSPVQFWSPRPCWLQHLGHRVGCWGLSILCDTGGNALR